LKKKFKPVRNPWMRPGDPVNLEKALQQWNNLKDIIEAILQF